MLLLKLDTLSKKQIELQTAQRVFSSETADLKNNLTRIHRAFDQLSLQVK